MKYYSAKIINEEPLKIGASGSKATQIEGCLEYIPGSTLRGAWINKLFCGSEYTEAQKIQALTGINFYNAYPCYTENNDLKQTIPVPKNIRVDKHELRKEEYLQSLNLDNKNRSVDIENILDINNILNDKSEQKRVNTIGGRYVNIKSEEIKRVQIPKTYRFHHNTKRNKDSENNEDNKGRDNLFRYEAVDKGQQFLSIIGVDDNIDETLKKAFNDLIESTNTINLGGSKTSGYGACKIEKLEGNTPNSKYLTPIETNKDNQAEYVHILALSDCLLRDEFGWPTNNLDRCLADILGEDAKCLELEKKIVDVGYSQGYNNKWKSRLPKEAFVEAGSIWKYKWNTGHLAKEIDKDKIIIKLKSYFTENLYGERQTDGSGWMMINPSMPTKLLASKQNCSEKLEVNNQEQSLKSELKKEINNSFIDSENSNVKILLQGFSDGRTEWQKDIVYKELNLKENIFIDLDKLTSNRIQILIDTLKEYKESILKLFYDNFKADIYVNDVQAHIYETDNKTENQLKRSIYAQNDKVMNLQGFNFYNCFEYLKNPKDNILAIDMFVNQKLDTVQGMLYYGEFDCDEKIKKGLFLSEFLIQTFEYIKRKEEDKVNGK